MRKQVLPALEDPEHSVDVFDADRMNDKGGAYCVAPAVHPSLADQYWRDYQLRQWGEMARGINDG